MLQGQVSMGPMQGLANDGIHYSPPHVPLRFTLYNFWEQPPEDSHEPLSQKKLKRRRSVG